MLPERPDKAQMLEQLHKADAKYLRAKHDRYTAAVNARKAGLTNQQIGDAYGLTEQAIRALIKRGNK